MRLTATGSRSFVVYAVTLLLLLVLLLDSAGASTGFHSAASVPVDVKDESSSTLPTRINDTSTINTTNSSTEVDAVPSAQSNSDDSASLTDAEKTLPEWRRQLPSELRNKTKTLQRIIVPGSNGCCVEIYLLGTAHVSMDSSRDVRLLLDAVDPSVLFLELCDQRIPMMLAPPPAPSPSPVDQNVAAEQEPKRGFWRRLFRPGAGKPKQKKSPPPEGSRSMYGMAAGLLTNMQQDYAQSLGVELGGEFRVAYNYWDEHRQDQRIHMILGDRPLYLTLTRAWEGLGLWGKTKLVVSLLVSSFQKPNPDELREWMQKILSDDTGDLLTESIAELAQHFPTLEQVIIQERDTYMACKLYQTCRQLLQLPQEPPHQIPKVRRLVAIVGAGHVQGMCRLLTQGDGKQPEELLSPLVKLRKPISEQEREILINDVLEVNHELLQSMAQELRAS
jgi:pheromone shutdown protein TraB